MAARKAPTQVSGMGRTTTFPGTIGLFGSALPSEVAAAKHRASASAPAASLAIVTLQPEPQLASWSSIAATASGISSVREITVSTPSSSSCWATRTVAPPAGFG